MTVHNHDCESLAVSSVALGTYLGAANDDIDAQMELVLLDAINSGINYIDSAANYRNGRSERVIGRALTRLENAVSNSVIVGTKVGYLPYDSSVQDIVDDEYFRVRFVDAGIVKREWVVGDWQCFHPAYLEWQFCESKTQLQRQTIDIYYLHNPESMLPFLNRDEFRQTMKAAFAWCVSKVRSGQIKFFGISTWSGLLGLAQEESLSLVELFLLAESVGGRDYFKFIQAPFSAGLTHALTHRTQTDLNGNKISLLRLASVLGMHFFGSAPLLHGDLLIVDCPKELRALFPWPSATQTYLDFARSCPGVATTIVGTTRQSHLLEAAALLNKEPNPGAFMEFFRR